MDELFRIIEDKIRTAGYAGPVDGLEDVYKRQGDIHSVTEQLGD